MLQGRKSFAGRVADSVRMCMYMVCGVRENRYKQPECIENSAWVGFLQKNNFSREEIPDGIKEITHTHDTDGIL